LGSIVVAFIGACVLSGLYRMVALAHNRVWNGSPLLRATDLDDVARLASGATDVHSNESRAAE
jgi:hypothetical protein